MNQLNKEDFSAFWAFSSSRDAQTLMYNIGNVIYMEIIPTYPWTHFEQKPKDNYYSYEDFIKQYKPYAVEIIPLEAAKEWLKQCQELLKTIDYDFE